ncbi:hypothetical protein F4677DRAFT_420228 [Hypoxylon crocopeplum]|nr:hypothetical protein F4677DRAFT_420228 [Hypoxylon crocopeplum]
MMSCSCRTTSLRIFVQSLTELRISKSNSIATTTTRRIQSQYPRAVSYQPRCIPSRSYSAAAAIGFPQQTSRGIASYSEATTQVSETARRKSSDDAMVDESSAAALDASAVDLDRAKRDGAILDFSLESIDSLVANLDKSSSRDVTSRDKHASPTVQLEADSKPASFTGPSRLKRLKIIKEDTKKETDEWIPPKREHWQIQKSALREKFPEGWSPRKRLSPDALDGIRALHSQFPEDYTTEVLAEKFEVSPEAIRRILRSKWTPNPEEDESRQERWFNRGKNIWSQMAALGKKPPRRWRREGIVRDPVWNRPRGPRTQPPRERQQHE